VIDKERVLRQFSIRRLADQPLTHLFGCASEAVQK